MGLGLGLALGGILVSIGRRAVLAAKFGLYSLALDCLGALP